MLRAGGAATPGPTKRRDRCDGNSRRCTGSQRGRSSRVREHGARKRSAALSPPRAAAGGGFGPTGYEEQGNAKSAPAPSGARTGNQPQASCTSHPPSLLLPFAPQTAGSERWKNVTGEPTAEGGLGQSLGSVHGCRFSACTCSQRAPCSARASVLEALEDLGGRGARHTSRS